MAREDLHDNCSEVVDWRILEGPPGEPGEISETSKLQISYATTASTAVFGEKSLSLPLSISLCRDSMA